MSSMKMNRTISVLLCAVLLSACSDASASIKDKDTPVIKVGDTAITKGQVYEKLLSSYGAPAVMQYITEVICDNEVEVTDEMKKTAEDNLEYYKSILGPYFEEYMTEQGMDEESFLKQQILMQQNDRLPSQYIEENYTELAEKYKPILGTILSFETMENANAAASALKDGSMNVEEAIKAYGSTSTGESELITIDSRNYDAEAIAVLRAAEPDDGWVPVQSTSGTAYVLRVEEKDYDALKEQAMTAFASISDVQSAAMKFFCEKYGFKVYDISLISDIYKNYPYILNQSIPSSLTD